MYAFIIIIYVAYTYDDIFREKNLILIHVEYRATARDVMDIAQFTSAGKIVKTLFSHGGFYS